MDRRQHLMPTTFRTPVHFFHPMFLITLLFDEASYWYVGMRYKQNVKCTEDKKKITTLELIKALPWICK